MITLKLEQGSEQWLEARLGHFTASEAPAMMGDSKYMSRNELLKLKKTGKSKPITDHQQSLFDKGHATEASARPIIEEIIGEDLYPVTGVLEETNFLASFDGLTIMNDIVYEHKLWNETLAENVRNNVLEPHYYWQLEQQLLVSGAEKAIFVTSDGTEAKMERMEYISQPERREALIAGWYQFNNDLAVYQVEVVKEAAIAAEVESFPLITYQVAGTEISSNIADCLDVITQRSQVEIARVLETDQDFANKDQLNKATKKARDSLKAMVKEVQGKFVSYSEFATVAAQIDSVLQKMQSHGEKQVKQAKAAKKQAIEDAGIRQVIDHIDVINKAINPISLSSLMNCLVDFNSVMKNKRTIESLQNAVDEAVAQFKIESDRICAQVKVNLMTLRELAGDYKFLFNDTPQLVIKDNEDLVAVIKTRIADHEEAEKVKADKLREDIRLEEEAKAEKKIEGDNLIKSWEAAFDEAAKAKTVDEIEQYVCFIEHCSIDKELFGDRFGEAEDIYLVNYDGIHKCLEKLKAEADEKAKEESQPEEMVVRKETLQEPITENFLPDETVDDIPIEQTPEDKPDILAVKGFLEWAVCIEDVLNDFGHLLLTDDPQHNAEALDNIRTNFNNYISA